MKIIPLMVVALIGVSMAVIFQRERKEYAVLCSIITGCVLLFMVIGELSGLFDAIKVLTEQYGISLDYLTLMLKTIGIAYLCQFGITLCKDAGQGAIALKLEIAGRVLLLGCALPAIMGLIEIGAELLSRLRT